MLTDQQMAMPETLCPTEEDQFLENIQFTMEELLGGPVYGEYGGCSPNTQFTMDEMFSRCCGPPTAVAPMDAGFFDGLAF